MNRTIIIIVILAAVTFFFKNFKSSKLKYVSIQTLRGSTPDLKIEQGPQIDKCFAKEKCILIYVAPWCPACHEFIAHYSIVKAQLTKKNIGSLFIVGGDENRSKEIALKDELGEDAILDTVKGDFRKYNFVDQFPYFIVVDATGKVFESGSRAIDYLNKVVNSR